MAPRLLDIPHSVDAPCTHLGDDGCIVVVSMRTLYGYTSLLEVNDFQVTCPSFTLPYSLRTPMAKYPTNSSGLPAKLWLSTFLFLSPTAEALGITGSTMSCWRA